MSFKQKLTHEIKAVVLTTLYFAVWFSVLVAVKALILTEYRIHFSGLTVALVGALIVAKVVLILEHVPLGSWLRRQSPLTDVLLRTCLYAIGVVIVLFLEKAFESRHESGGFISALGNVFQHRDVPHIWANAIVVTGALFFFNLLAALRQPLGGRGIAQVLLTSPSPSPSTGAGTDHGGHQR
jgi:hypothetical protein